MRRIWECLGLRSDEVSELVRIWKRQKWEIMKKYMPKPTLKYMLDIVDEPALKSYLRLFREKYGLDLSMFTFEELKENRSRSGEKIGKMLRKMVKEDMRAFFDEDWNRFRRVFVQGTLIITCAVDELVIISDPAKWSSCHAFGKERFWANVSYSLDPVTVLIYLTNDEQNEQFGKPLKIWRMLCYWLDDEQVLITSRQYPYDSYLIYTAAVDILKNMFFSGQPVRKFKPNVEIIYPNVDDIGFCPYLDRAYFEFYGLELKERVVLDLTSNVERTKIYKINPGPHFVCARCGAPVEEYYAYVDDNDGEIYCSDCWRYHAYCDRCGATIWMDTEEYEQDGGIILCASCIDELEPFECPRCGRLTFILCEVHEEKMCYHCATKRARQLREYFMPLPFYPTESQNIDLLWDLTWVQRIIPD